MRELYARYKESDKNYRLLKIGETAIAFLERSNCRLKKFHPSFDSTAGRVFAVLSQSTHKTRFYLRVSRVCFHKFYGDLNLGHA